MKRLLPFVAGALLATSAAACGPDGVSGATEWPRRPDWPLDAFARGEIGVIEPTWAHSYLVVAWRMLHGHPLTAGEQAALVDHWHRRLGPWWTDEAVPDAAERWLALHEKLTGTRPELGLTVPSPDGWGVTTNCVEGAFSLASDTLEARVAELGADAPEVRDWLLVQDAVFARCSGATPLPDPLPPLHGRRARADRDYQLAAAALYVNDTDEAVRRFLAIGRDGSSEWRPWGRYLAARALLRRSRLDAARSKEDLALAERLLLATLADPKDAARHHDARSLLNRIQATTRPDELLVTLSEEMTSGTPAAIESSVAWLADLLDRKSGGGVTASTDLSDWVAAMRSPDTRQRAHAIERWRATASTAWLLAALQLADPASADELLDAARDVPAAHPASPSLVRASAWLLVRRGDARSARDVLEPALARAGPISSRNRLLDARLVASSSLDDLARFLPREIAGYAWDGSGMMPEADVSAEERRGLLSEAGAHVIDAHLATRAVATLAQHADVPRPLRTSLAASAFVRAVLLRDDELVARLAPILSAEPELAASLAPVAAADDAVERRRLAILALGRLRGLMPVHGSVIRTPADMASTYARAWCDVRASTPEPAGGSWGPFAAHPFDALPPAFLGPDDLRARAEETAALEAAGAACRWLSAEALAWSREAPQDARVAEVLHRAVRASRNAWCDCGEASQAAFRELHRRFPKSAWAARTPYWYE